MRCGLRWCKPQSTKHKFVKSQWSPNRDIVAPGEIIYSSLLGESKVALSVYGYLQGKQDVGAVRSKVPCHFSKGAHLRLWFTSMESWKSCSKQLVQESFWVAGDGIYVKLLNFNTIHRWRREKNIYHLSLTHTESIISSPTSINNQFTWKIKFVDCIDCNNQALDGWLGESKWSCM